VTLKILLYKFTKLIHQKDYKINIKITLHEVILI